MTSEAGRKRTSKDRGEPDGAGRSARLIRPTAPVRAFTILELLLALAVLVLLLTLAVVGLDQLRSRAWLDEGVSRFETVLRMARTEAAGRGQRLQLAFDDASGAVDLLIEADPLGAPGQFQPFTGCTWLHQLPNDLVRVRRSVIGAAGFHANMSHDNDDAGLLDAITFYPDGSADSVRLELASLHPDDTRWAMIELEGLSGRIRSSIVHEGSASASGSSQAGRTETTAQP